MLPTFCVTVSPNFSQIDISVIEINSVLGIGVSLSIYILNTKHIYIYNKIYIYIYRLAPMPRTLFILITLMSIWLKFGETVTQKAGNMILRSYPGTS